MRIHSTVHGSRANGPAIRSVIWTQGCGLFCPSCWNPATHPFDAGEQVNPEELAERIVREAPSGTSGVTLSGGEPMSQAVSVYRFLTMLHAIRPDWSAGLFTGFTHTELSEGSYDLREWLPLDRPGIRALLWSDQIRPHLDWACIGRYDRTRPPAEIPEHRQDRHFVSSGNQFLDIYRRYAYADFRRIVEVNIASGGLTTITGFPMKVGA